MMLVEIHRRVMFGLHDQGCQLIVTERILLEPRAAASLMVRFPTSLSRRGYGGARQRRFPCLSASLQGTVIDHAES